MKITKDDCITITDKLLTMLPKTSLKVGDKCVVHPTASSTILHPITQNDYNLLPR